MNKTDDVPRPIEREIHYLFMAIFLTCGVAGGLLFGPWAFIIGLVLMIYQAVRVYRAEAKYGT